MAARYIAAIRRVQPEGPYQLGGFCFGGVVAFEMARQLKAAGEHVALLAIIEGSAPRRFHEPPPLWQPQRLALVWQSAPYWLRGYREFGGYHWKRWLKRRLGRDRAQRPSSHPTKTPSATEFDNLADFNAARPANQLALRRVNIDALRDYRPEPYEGDVTFFRARCLRIGHAFRAPIDPQRGWGTLSLGRVQMQFVDGTHSGILTKPYVQDLGTRLADALADTRRS